MAATNTCYIRFLHAAPNTPNVDIYVNSSISAKNISYTEFTKYFTASPGIYKLQAFPADKYEGAILDETVELFENTIYSAAITGLSGNISAELIPDTKAVVDKNRAYARFINLSPYNTNFDITLNNNPAVSDLVYKEVTGYETLSPQNYYLRAMDHVTGELKLQVPKMLLKAGRMYAIYIVGQENKELKVLVPQEGATYLE